MVTVLRMTIKGRQNPPPMIIRQNETLGSSNEAHVSHIRPLILLEVSRFVRDVKCTTMDQTWPFDQIICSMIPCSKSPNCTNVLSLRPCGRDGVLACLWNALKLPWHGAIQKQLLHDPIKFVSAIRNEKLRSHVLLDWRTGVDSNIGLVLEQIKKYCTICYFSPISYSHLQP